MADVDRCACCGDPIPEGRQICPICEGIRKTIKKKIIRPMRSKKHK